MRYVAFLRAVNVAGHARVTTKSLIEAFESGGFERVESLYASGNIMFDSPARQLASRMRRVRVQLRRVLGEAPMLFVRTPNQLGRLLNRPPFSTRQRASRDKLWVAFLGAAPRVRLRLPVDLRKERLTLIAVRGREAFAVARPKPSGFSAIPNPLIEGLLRVPSTCRQWTTVATIAAALLACASPRSRAGEDSTFAALQLRGASAMGVDQYTSSHVFEPLPDGGRIVLQRDTIDAAGVATIRAHMSDTAARFGSGEFTIPGFVHAQTVPGTAVMAARKATAPRRTATRPDCGCAIHQRVVRLHPCKFLARKPTSPRRTMTICSPVLAGIRAGSQVNTSR